MRRFRFYTDRDKLRIGSSVKLPDFEEKHILKSLRLKKGDEIFLFNGIKEYKAKLKLVSKDAVMAEITEEYRDSSEEFEKEITLFQGLTKAKSFELTLDYATELGVNTIVPVKTEYSVIELERKAEKKFERWGKIILSAVKQCERVSIPKLHEPIDFSEIKDLLGGFDIVLFCVTEVEDRISLGEIREEIEEEGFKKIGVIIGPEGGFSEGEIGLLKDKSNVRLVRLHRNVLRSELGVVGFFCHFKI